MIDVKQAVRIARKSFAELMDLDPPQVQDILLEEVERSEEKGKQWWRITLSVPWKDLGALAAQLNPRVARDYKVFTIDAESGEVASMKIRQLDAA